MSEAMPISTAPRDGTHILIFIPRHAESSPEFTGWFKGWRSDGVDGGCWATGVWEVDAIDYLNGEESYPCKGCFPTHWMPLPPDPIA